MVVSAAGTCAITTRVRRPSSRAACWICPSSDLMRPASGSMVRPASVISTRRRSRENRGALSSCSRARICRERFGWVVPSRRAALPKWRVSHSAKKNLRCLNSISVVLSGASDARRAQYTAQPGQRCTSCTRPATVVANSNELDGSVENLAGSPDEFGRESRRHLLVRDVRRARIADEPVSTPVDAGTRHRARTISSRGGVAALL